MAAKVEEKEVSKKSKHEETIIRLNKEYGAGTVITGKMKPLDIASVSTGSIGLDIATGINGFPYGRIVEVIGPESVGKTTVCLHVIANAQRSGYKCAIIDAEHSIDAEYATALGVDMDEIVFNQPDYGEQGLEVAKQLMEAGEVKVIMIDSVAALVPKGELEGAHGDQKLGLQARMMGQSMRMITGVAGKNGCLVIFTNQLREKIGVMFGSPETTTGGNALKFYASMRIDMRKTPDAENELNKTRIKVIKNKCAKPFKTCEVQLIWGKGFNQEGEIIDLAVDMDIIQKSGSWFSYKDSKIGQGIASVTKLLEDNPEMMQEIKDLVLDKIHNKKEENVTESSTFV